MIESEARTLAIRKIALPGAELAYFEHGDPSGPLVVLQHGFPDYPKTFFPLMERLVARGYRCTCPS